MSDRSPGIPELRSLMLPARQLSESADEYAAEERRPKCVERFDQCTVFAIAELSIGFRTAAGQNDDFVQALAVDVNGGDTSAASIDEIRIEL